MRSSAPKSFDCVKSMREVRDQISTEIAEMSFEELTRWLREYRYPDRRLQLLADRAAEAEALAPGR